MVQNKYQYKVQGVDYDVEIEEIEGNAAKVKVNGIVFDVELKTPISPAHAISKPKVEAPKPAPREQTGTPDTTPVAPKPAAPAAGTQVKAPLPGTITSIKVKVGDTVGVGDVVLVLEAMKMQNNIEAESSGKIISINVNQGDAVMEGAVLLTIG